MRGATPGTRNRLARKLQRLKQAADPPMPLLTAEKTMTSDILNTTLGDLMSVLYEEYLSLYGDEDLASVATAATINEMIADAVAPSRASQKAEENAA